MKQLATTLRNDIDSLAARYEQYLREIPGYNTMPDQSRGEAARLVLELTADCLEENDYSPFSRFVRARVEERLAFGWTASAVTQAFSVLEEVLLPLISTVETAVFLWRMLSEARSITFETERQRLAEINAQREQAEEQLRHLSRVVEQSPNSIVLTKVTGEIEYVNPKFTSITGYTLQEAIGENPRILKSGDKPSEEYKRLWETITAGGTWQGEFHNRKKTGELFWESASISPITNAAGEITHFLAIKEDITGRKKLEEQIQASLERRGRQVRLSTVVAQEIAAAANLNDLYRRVVTQVKEQFGYYHAQLLRYDPAAQAVTLVAASDQVGAQMLAQGHRMPLGTGLIGAAAATGTAMLRSDVAADPDWQPNPLLPQTKGELAVPIKFGRENPEAQNLALQYFIRSGFDGVAVTALDPAAAGPITRTGIQQGVPVVAIAHPLGEGNQSSIIYAVEYEMGYMLGREAGEWARTHVPAGETLKVGLLHYRLVPHISQRERGIIEGIKAVFEGEMELVGSEFAGDPARGLGVAEKWLQAHPDLRMIVGINDGGALGAYRAVVAAGKDDPQKFFVGGIDAVEEALAAIKAGGAYQATVDLAPAVVGVLAVRILIAAVKNLPFPGENVIHCTPINRANLDAFLKTGRQDTASKTLVISEEALADLDLRGIRLGLSILTLTNPFFAAVAEAAAQEAARLGVQLVINDPQRLLGVLDVQSDVSGQLSAEDELALEGLCGQIAVAIESTYLRQEMEENLRELNSMQQALTREGWATFRETVSLPEGYLFDRTEVRLANDLWLPEIEEALAQKAIVPAANSPGAAVAPLLLQDEAIGVLGVYDDPDRPLSPADLALVQSVSEQVALALESARLFEQTQLTLAETELLYRASAELNTAQSYEDILEVLRRYTLLGYQSRAVSLNRFDRPWEGDQTPDWVNLLAYWSRTGREGISTRYALASFPSAAGLLQSEGPTLVEDVNTDPRLDENVRFLYSQVFKATSTIFIPLVAGGQWIGYANGLYDQPQPFSDAALRRMMSLAGQAAVAVQTLYLVAQMQEALAETRALYHFGEVISREINQQAVYDLVARLLVEELGYASARILEIDEPNQALQGIAGAGIPEEIIGQQLSLDDSQNPMVAAALERRIVVVNDPFNDPQAAFLPDEMKTAVGKLVAAPVLLGGKLIGLIGASRPLTAPDIGEREVRLLQAVANQMGVVVQRTQLFGQTHEALAVAEHLYEAGQRINGASDLQEVVAAVAEDAPIAVVRRGLLFLFDRDLAGQVEKATVVANWHRGDGRHPDPVGTVYSQAAIAALNVLLSPEPLFFDDIQHDARIDDPATLALLQEQNVRAVVVLPLWVGTRHLGTLLLEAEEPHRFTEHEIQPYLSLAPQVAVAVDNQRLLTETRSALAEVEATQRRYTLQAWETYLARQRMVLGYEQHREDLLPLGDGLPAEARQAVEQGKTTVSRGNGHQPTGENGPETGQQGVSSLVVPLTLRGEVVGVVGLQETDETRQWSAEEVELIEAICQQFIQSAEELRLLDESQQQAAREVRVNEITSKIQAAQSLEEALQIAVREVGLSLQAPQTMVELNLGAGPE